MLPPYLLDDRFSTVYTTGSILLQFVLIAVVANRLFPTLRRRIAYNAMSKLAPRDPDNTMAIGALQVFCCLAIAAQYVVLLVVGPGVPYNDLFDSASTFYRSCWGVATAVWLLCAVLVVYHVRARCLSGSSLRCWWLLNFTIASLELHAAIKMAVSPNYEQGSAQFEPQTPLVGQSSGVSIAAVAQFAAFLPHVVLFLFAVYQPSTPGMNSWNARVTSTQGAHLLAQEEASTVPSAAGRSKEGTASFYDFITFSWCGSLLKLGAKRPLEHSDLYDLEVGSQSATCCQNLHVLPSHPKPPPCADRYCPHHAKRECLMKSNCCTGRGYYKVGPPPVRNCLEARGRTRLLLLV